jgi:chitodextrinase
MHILARVRLLGASVVLSTLALVAPQFALASVGVSVDWNSTQRSIFDGAWGVNAPAFMDPSYTTNTTWMGLVGDITQKKPLVRIHGWGMMDTSTSGGQSWLNADGSWNASKIAQALTPVAAAGYAIMIDVPDGPGSNAGANIDPNLTKNPQAVANWLAQLVKIVNVDNHFNVKYWEFPNERDTDCNGSAGLTGTQMGTLLATAAKAMKAVDPTILVGGPALCWVDQNYILSMMSSGGGNIDFVTFHSYGGGQDYTNPTLSVRYDSAQNDLPNAVRGVVSALATASPARHIPLFLDEYNISYESSPNNYNFNNVGAVYDALVATRVADAGAEATELWELGSDSWHSLIYQNGTLRYPSSNLWTMLNKYFYGQEVAAISNNTAAVAAFATKSTTGTHALILINRSSTAQSVTLSSLNYTLASPTKYVIDASGFTGPVAYTPGSTISMNAQSIAFIIDGPDSGGGLGTVATSTPPPADTQAPSQPTSLAASGVSSSQINLTWSASVDNVGVVGYKVYRNGVQVGIANMTSFSDTGLNAGTTYSYTVAAYDAAGNTSSTSPGASATTKVAAVAIGARVKTTATVNVRQNASTKGRILGTQPLGVAGTVTKGPQQGSGYTWWYVNFDSGADGWVAGNYLTAQL